DARDEGVGEDQLGFAAAHQTGHFHIRGVVDFGHDVVRLGAAVGVVGNGQDGLDDARVRVIFVGAQHDDGAGGIQVHDLQVGEVDGVAGAAHDPRMAGGADLVADDGLHLHLVYFAQDGDARLAAMGVGDHQLGDDGK